MSGYYILFITICIVTFGESRHTVKQDVQSVYIRPLKWKLFEVKKPVPQFTDKRSFYTNATYKLVLGCSVRLLCIDNAYVKAYGKNGDVIMNYCSFKDKYEETPKPETLEKMDIEFYTGSSTVGRYDCMIYSVPTDTSTSKPCTPTPPPVGKCQCGKSKASITVGAPSSKGAVPWQVGLGFRRTRTFSLFCGGALVSSNYVITAAHCVEKTGLNIQVFMGDVDLNSQSATFVGVSNIQKHEQYNSPLPYSNDIALVTLDKSVAFTDAIYPVCLPRGSLSSETYADKKLYVSGWATLESGRATYPDSLEAAPVEGKANRECKTSYPDLTDSMLCITATKKDACLGDSGGPLTYTQSSVGYLVGVASYGSGCSKPNSPEVFTRMTEYLDWIDSKTATPICSI